MEDQTEILLDLFTHPGWKILKDMRQEAHDVLIETAWTLKDERALYFRKGEIQQLGAFLAFENSIKAQVDERNAV